MKIIFFGSDDFAAAHLQELIGSSHHILACVTQPDKPKGRGLNVAVSPIKELAQRNQVPVLQPESLKENKFLETLRGFQSDLFVVIAYGKFLPASILKMPKIFAINVHGSLLPKYRGAAPIHWAIINGEKKTGLSIIRMNEEMDAGDVVAQMKVAIEDKDTSATLRSRMMALGAKFLIETIDGLANKNFTLTAQNIKQVSFAPKLTKELGKIDWEKNARQIHNLVRGLSPWPSAYTFYDGKMLKILNTQVVSGSSSNEPGTITAIDKKGFVVATTKDSLLIEKVHFESSKMMDAYSFLQGKPLKVGSKLGV